MIVDVIDRFRRQDFIRHQLSLYGGPKKETGERMMILCPYHADRTPSGSIWLGSQGTGKFRCFACKSEATWDELAERLQLQPFKKGPPKEENAMDLLMYKGMQLLTDTSGFKQDEFRFKPIPSNKYWRSIPTNLLIELGGKFCTKWIDKDDGTGFWSSTKFIYLPVNINGEQRGYFRARLRKDKTGNAPSYLLAATESGTPWAKQFGLWPFDYAIELMHKLDSSTITLVEGQRDALRLLLSGVPAVCIFGTQSWSDSKAKLLEIAGVERVIMLMDGDCAGKDATERIKPEARRFFDVVAIRLWNVPGSPYLKFKNEPDPTKAAKAAHVDLWDPGNCPISIVQKLKNKYFP
jgi:hypothetical protein